ncbi:MAG: protease modulator HflK [Thermoguttaceae bacterium]|jgi:membrane protease subunit HflK|nr:protease modulator HflK [Thermoguttaceae bacterium]
MSARRARPTPVVFQGLDAGLRMFRWVILILLGYFLVSGFENVKTDNVGLLLRFGGLTGASRAEQIRQPGLVRALPYPIDELLQVPGPQREGSVALEEVWKPIGELAALDKINPIVEGYCLTGDQNVIQARLSARYWISDPIRFRLFMDDPEGMLHDAVIASLTQTVAEWQVNDVLRLQRGGEGGPGTMESLATVVQRRAQERLDAVDCGMQISAIEFKEIHPPRHVVAAFRDVQNARIEIETKKREAEGFVLGRIPAAEAEANRMVKSAMAYDNTLNARASAELSVFEQVYAEYRNNPGVVRQRLLMETLEAVLTNVGRRIHLPLGSRVILPPPGEMEP